MVVKRVLRPKSILFFAVIFVITQVTVNAEDSLTQDVNVVQKDFWFIKGVRNLFSFNLKQNVLDPSNTSELIAYPIQSPTKTDYFSEFPSASDSPSSSDFPTRSPRPTSFPTQFGIDAYLYIVNSNITVFGSFERNATDEELKEFEKVFYDYFQDYYSDSYGEFGVIEVNILYQDYQSEPWDDRFLQARRSKRNKNTFVTSSASWFNPPPKQANIVPAEDSLNSPSRNRRLQSSDIIDRLHASNNTYLQNVTDIEAVVKETEFIPISSPTTFPVPSIEPLTEFPSDVPTFKIKETENPSEFPTEYPTDFPSEFPTDFPSEFPTEFPSEFPTEFPSEFPTEFPSEFPTEYEYDYDYDYSPYYDD